MSAPEKPRRCEGCNTPEATKGWLRFFTRITECNLCGLLLCENCLTDRCEVTNAPHEPRDAISPDA